MKVKYAFYFILLFLFFSCSNNSSSFSTADLFDSGEYGDAFSQAERETTDDIFSDALYYKASAAFILANLEEAAKSSYLYLLLHDCDDSNYYGAAEILLRSTLDNSLLLYAGDLLYEAGRLNRVDYLTYYRALYSNNLFARADEFYYAIESSLSSFEKALVRVSSDADSAVIASALEELYDDIALDQRFINLMKRAIRIFIDRGDGSMLLDLIEYGDGNDLMYDLLIGDLYYSLNKNEEAARYWEKASSSYPREVQLRLNGLSRSL